MSRPGVRVSSPALVDSRGQRRTAALALAAVLAIAVVLLVARSRFRDNVERGDARRSPRAVHRAQRAQRHHHDPRRRASRPRRRRRFRPRSIGRSVSRRRSPVQISPKSVDATGHRARVRAEHDVPPHDDRVRRDRRAREDDPRQRRPRAASAIRVTPACRGARRSRARSVPTTGSSTSRTTRCTATTSGPRAATTAAGRAVCRRATCTASDVKTLAITGVAQVGMVPKYVAVTPDNKYVLVTNWCSFDLSVIDRATFKEVQPHPARHRSARHRGEPRRRPSRTSRSWARPTSRASTSTRSRSAWFRGVGLSPRHVVLEPGRPVPLRHAQRRQPRRQARHQHRHRASPASRPGRSRAAWRSPPTAPRCTS